jgi:class 3 adenylate cyclase
MDRQEHKVERQLVAIFAADVAGYSCMMSQDEDGTLRSLTAHREIMDRLISEHAGRIVNGGSKVGHGAAQNWASGGRFAPWRAR